MGDTANKLLITVTGPDRTGVTAELTGIIAQGGLGLVDMEQVVIAGQLVLSIVMEAPGDRPEAQPVLKELLFAAKTLGLTLDFQVLGEEAVPPAGPPQTLVLTVIGHETLPAAAVARVASVLATHGYNIEAIRQLGQRRIRCLEMVVSGAGGDEKAHALKEALLPVSREYPVDLALQPDTLARRVKRLVVFDLDSTLVQAEVIDELARAAGVQEEVGRITARAMNGELDFTASLHERVALLAGLPEETLEQVYRALPLTPGAEALIRTLQWLGYRTAIISGGFDYVTERLRTRLGLDYAYGNRLEIEGGRLTGRVLEPVIDGRAKADLLDEIAGRERIRLDQVVAVGDGANDLPMLERAGLGVAFNAKPAVQLAAEHAVNQQRLDTILFLLGISEDDLAALHAEGLPDGTFDA